MPCGKRAAARRGIPPTQPAQPQASNPLLSFRSRSRFCSWLPSSQDCHEDSSC